jgi:hypothetical protein
MSTTPASPAALSAALPPANAYAWSGNNNVATLQSAICDLDLMRQPQLPVSPDLSATALRLTAANHIRTRQRQAVLSGLVTT